MHLCSNSAMEECVSKLVNTFRGRLLLSPGTNLAFSTAANMKRKYSEIPGAEQHNTKDDALQKNQNDPDIMNPLIIFLMSSFLDDYTLLRFSLVSKSVLTILKNSV